MTDRQTLFTDYCQEELAIIAEYAKAVPAEGQIVDIGTGRGGQCIWLRRYTQAAITTIDPYPPSGVPDLLARINVQSERDASERVALRWPQDKPVNLLLVDGAHDFASVYRDLDRWLPRMADDGVMIFDDYDEGFRAGLGNLAVYVLLTTAKTEGVISVERTEASLLIARKGSWPIRPSFLSRCRELLQGMLESGDSSKRAICWLLADKLPERFWDMSEECDDPDTFREAVSTYHHLTLFGQTVQGVPWEPMLEAVSGLCAYHQARLDLLWAACKAYGTGSGTKKEPSNPL